MMTIREANLSDIPSILYIYTSARLYMRNHGNSMQWGAGDRPEDKTEQDIARRECFVGTDEIERPHFVFSFRIGEDPSYRKIKGKWLNDKSYGTIHRLGSDGTIHGVFEAVLSFCKERCFQEGVYNLRGDTHENNKTMRHVMEKNGFIYCGMIQVEDGTARFAYQLIL